MDLAITCSLANCDLWSHHLLPHTCVLWKGFHCAVKLNLQQLYCWTGFLLLSEFAAYLSIWVFFFSVGWALTATVSNQHVHHSLRKTYMCSHLQFRRSKLTRLMDWTKLWHHVPGSQLLLWGVQLLMIAKTCVNKSRIIFTWFIICCTHALGPLITPQMLLEGDKSSCQPGWTAS